MRLGDDEMDAAFEKYAKKTKYDLGKQVKKDNFVFLNENYCEKEQTVLIGDSITEIFNWYELFADFSKATGQAVYNRGISGDTSDRLLERLDCNALNISPRNLILLIGTNDLGIGAPPAFTVENVRAIANRVRQQCPNTNLVLQGVYPVNKWARTDAFAMVGKRRNETIAELNEELKTVALHTGAFWLDLTDVLSDKKGRLAKEYTYDGLHLNVHGFCVAAENIIPCLK